MAVLLFMEFEIDLKGKTRSSTRKDFSACDQRQIPANLDVFIGGLVFRNFLSHQKKIRMRLELEQGLRYFSRRKGHLAIVVLSLAAGFTCSILLLSFLVGESEVDRFHPRSERTYQVISENPFGGDGHLVYTVGGFSDYLTSNFPEIEAACQVGAVNGAEVEVSSEVYSPVVTIETDPSFLEIFDFTARVGSLTPNSILITEALARKQFGTTDVQGRSIKWRSPDTTRVFEVAGLIQPKGKSHLVFDAVVFHPTGGGATYAVINSSAADLVSKINADSLRPTLVGPGRLAYGVQPLFESYLDPTNRFAFMQTRSRGFIQIGWLVAAVVLLIACFNFVNLTLQSWQERTIQTGIKKTLGISNQRLLLGAFGEVTLIVGASLIIALFGVYTLLPWFSQVVKADVSIWALANTRVIGFVLLLVVLIISIITFSIFLFQRRVVPVRLIQHRHVAAKESQVFFTLQFVVSTVLCICAVVMVRQIRYLEQEPLGFNRNLLQVAPPPTEKAKLPELKNQLLQSSKIDHVALSEGNPISGNMIARYELPDGRIFTPYLFQGDADLLSTLKLSGVDGSLELNDTTDVLVNQKLVQYFGMTSPVGKQIPGTNMRISGVVKDFTCSSFKQEVPPAIISYEPKAKLLLVDYSNQTLGGVLPELRKSWKAVFGDTYMEVRVLQDDLMKKYSDETMLLQVVFASSVVSIVLSCFGLFAMSISIIHRRRREMGIRKVLGAVASDIIWLLSSSFVRRSGVAFALAAPIAVYFTKEWVSHFSNRISIDGREFVLSGVTMLLVVVATLMFQTIKAGQINPVDEIRDLPTR